MAHFAQLNENNIVTNVVVVSDEQEHRGHDFLSKDLGLGGRWIQTSYNARQGFYSDPKTGELTNRPALRKNYAAIGYRYDETLDAFIPPKPLEFKSYVLDPETATWVPPIKKPEDVQGSIWFWSEADQKWFLVPTPKDPEMI